MVEISIPATFPRTEDSKISGGLINHGSGSGWLPCKSIAAGLGSFVSLG
jgi:hypothetical protein